MSKATEPALVSGCYTQPYNEIVKPSQVWKVTKYFLRRWVTYMPPSYLWLIIGARQESYFNHNQPWFVAYDKSLAKAAGIHVRSYRRKAKKDIEAGKGALSYFIKKTGKPKYITGQPVPKQEETHYKIRLDDPLTPGDAAALVYWMRHNAPQEETAVTIRELLTKAIHLHPKQLRADSIMPKSTNLSLLSVADVVGYVFPSIVENPLWRGAADRLHTHIIESHLVHIEPQYFRLKWLQELGPGPALLFVYLRSLCYHNEQTGETRDQVVITTGELEAIFQKSSVTIRSWFTTLQEAIGNDDLFGSFYKVVDTKKMANQKVETTYSINLLTPIASVDLLSYHTKIEAMEIAKDQLSRGVSKEMSATSIEAGESFVSHVAGGEQRNVSHVSQGDESFVRGSEKKCPPYKYYKYLLDALNLSDFDHLLKRTNQQQHVWLLEGEQALWSFAAAAADNSPEKLLTLFNIQGTTRSRIKQAGLSLEAIVAWYLYALNEDGLQSPDKFMMKQAVAGESPPDDFLVMAQLSWELWRTYAVAWQLYDWLEDEKFDVFTQLPHFSRWRDLYANVLPEHLPFGVGVGVGELITLIPTTPSGLSASKDATKDPPNKGQTIALTLPSGAEYTNWEVALSELELQMTKATFNTWLKGARLLGRKKGTYVIGVRNDYARDWLENRLVDIIARTLTAIIGETAELRFIVWNADEDVVQPVKEDGPGIE